MILLRFILPLLLVLPLSLARAQVLEDEKNIDPLESINRPIYALNNGLDRFLIRPLAQTYHIVMPDVGERGVGNFFANLYDANALFNALLQWRLEGAAESGGRFLVNSTAGFLGLIDVATPIGIRPYRTDFGHTLAIWGFESGPYIMVPFFGPRTIRSGTGTIVDVYASPQVLIDDVRLRNTLYGLELIDGRARLLKAEELMSGDRYIFVRDAYLQQRESFVNDGVVEDNFSDFDDGGWEDDF
jgi:phospholipid-binding lipoprotein MlaA